MNKNVQRIEPSSLANEVIPFLSLGSRLANGSAVLNVGALSVRSFRRQETGK